jgi:excinuclease ABC subunit C
MSEVVRRRYSRILLEGRKVLGETDADASQENPLEAMRRLEQHLDDPLSRITHYASDAGDPASSIGNSHSALRNPKFVTLPDLVIIDGGKGQLGVAMKELQSLGLHDLPVIGLAKEEEEIYRPGIEQPLRIPHDRGALKLLQRIRDEAHRWANGYHQLLLSRRVEESILDDCPGVSQTRKSNMLRAFGSVARLRRAGAEEIAKVPGIGKVLAEEITRFLAERK